MIVQGALARSTWLPSIKRVLSGLALASTVSLSGLQPAAAVSVLTQHNDVSRSGANLSETVLTPANVNLNQFGKLFATNVDGDVYAQPLYAPAVHIGAGTPNVLYVATMHNTVYAFNADTGSILWTKNFGPSIPIGDVQFISDIDLELGILGTPVIDPATNYMYFVAANKDADGSYHNRLHVISSITGVDVVPAVDIQAQVPGTGDDTFTDSNNVSWVPFNAMRENQRPAMLLLPDPRSKSTIPAVKAKYLNAKIVYIAWASHNDIRPYHGWLIGYGIDPSTNLLVQTGVYNTTPNGTEGGIWQSGQGPTADADGNFYVMTGNGTSTINQSGGTDMSETFVKLTPSTVDASLSVADWFMPYNFDGLNGADADLGSAGVMILPGTNYIIGGGKQSLMYVLDKSNLGKYTPGSDNIHQEFQAGVGHIHGSPVYYKSPSAGPLIYVWSEADALHAYQFNAGTGLFNPTPFSTSHEIVPDGMPGAMLSISANGNVANTGIVWATMPLSGNANNAVVPGIVRAYDAQNLTRELWDSSMVKTDIPGSLSKFTPVTVANGKVYVPTFSGKIIVYGPLPTPTSVPTAPVLKTLIAGNAQSVATWAPSTGARSYKVYRGTTPGNETLLASSVATNTYTDKTSVNGQTYYYKIAGSNLLGDSPLSNELSGTPAAPVVGTGVGLLGQYYSNTTLTGTPVLERTDATINFNWNGGSPKQGVVPGANWSGRWTGYVQPQYTEGYTFYGTADDGIRVWVNDVLVADGWRDQGPTTYSGAISLTAGTKYKIEVEYYQGGGGSFTSLEWSSPRTPRQIVPKSQLYLPPAVPAPVVGTGTGLFGQYFTNIDLTAPDKAERVDPTVNFTWDGASPIANVPGTNFSTRWTGRVVPQYDDVYTFYLAGDDGVRLWVNGVKVLDGWFFQGVTEYSGLISLARNKPVNITAEYFQGGGGAACQLSWSSAHTAKQIIPATQLFPVPAAPGGLIATSGNGKVSLKWNNPTGGNFTGISIYRGATSHGEAATPIATVTGTSYVDTTVVNGNTYYYYAKAVNGAGTTVASNEVIGKPLATLP